MSTTTWPAREAEILDQLSTRYRSRGYAVDREVLLDGSTLRADLVLRRGDETVLVEVQPSGGDRSAAKLKRLAEYAASHGWRFSIVMARDGADLDEVDVLTRDEVLRRIADARAVDASSWIAPIAAAAAFEAAARFVLARSERRAMPRTTPGAYLQALAAQGSVTPEQEKGIRQLIEARNTATHGIEAPALPKAVVEGALDVAAALVVEADTAAA